MFLAFCKFRFCQKHFSGSGDAIGSWQMLVRMALARSKPFGATLNALLAVCEKKEESLDTIVLAYKVWGLELPPRQISKLHDQFGYGFLNELSRRLGKETTYMKKRMKMLSV